jgi:hypothetical protein
LVRLSSATVTDRVPRAAIVLVLVPALVATLLSGTDLGFAATPQEDLAG